MESLFIQLSGDVYISISKNWFVVQGHKCLHYFYFIFFSILARTSKTVEGANSGSTLQHGSYYVV